MNREEKLEAALKAALRMRRHMKDLGPATKVLLVPRELVENFDATMKQLEKKNG